MRVRFQLPLFDTVDTLKDTLRIFAEMVGGITVKPEAMERAAVKAAKRHGAGADCAASGATGVTETVEPGSGNVFAGPGFPDTDARLCALIG